MERSLLSTLSDRIKEASTDLLLAAKAVVDRELKKREQE